MFDQEIVEYLNNLNSNEILADIYEKIINFENKYYIPAVKKETFFFLNWIARLKKPENILEIGFGSGASSFAIHYGYDQYKFFLSLERDNNRFIRGINLLKNFNIEKIKILKKDAFLFLKESTKQFDFIFLDAVKRDYLEYLPLLKKVLKKDGILICDNIIFNKRVLQEQPEEKYKGTVLRLKKFNEIISQDNDLKTIFLPIGDGLSISIKN